MLDFSMGPKFFKAVLTLVQQRVEKIRPQKTVTCRACDPPELGHTLLMEVTQEIEDEFNFNEVLAAVSLLTGHFKSSVVHSGVQPGVQPGVQSNNMLEKVQSLPLKEETVAVKSSPFWVEMAELNLINVHHDHGYCLSGGQHLASNPRDVQSVSSSSSFPKDTTSCDCIEKYQAQMELKALLDECDVHMEFYPEVTSSELQNLVPGDLEDFQEVIQNWSVPGDLEDFLEVFQNWSVPADLEPDPDSWQIGHVSGLTSWGSFITAGCTGTTLSPSGASRPQRDIEEPGAVMLHDGCSGLVLTRAPAWCTTTWSYLPVMSTGRPAVDTPAVRPVTVPSSPDQSSLLTECARTVVENFPEVTLEVVKEEERKTEEALRLLKTSMDFTDEDPSSSLAVGDLPPSVCLPGTGSAFMSSSLPTPVDTPVTRKRRLSKAAGKERSGAPAKRRNRTEVVVVEEVGKEGKEEEEATTLLPLSPTSSPQPCGGAASSVETAAVKGALEAVCSQCRTSHAHLQHIVPRRLSFAARPRRVISRDSAIESEDEELELPRGQKEVGTILSRVRWKAGSEEDSVFGSEDEDAWSDLDANDVGLGQQTSSLGQQTSSLGLGKESPDNRVVESLNNRVVESRDNQVVQSHDARVVQAGVAPGKTNTFQSLSDDGVPGSGESQNHHGSFSEGPLHFRNLDDKELTDLVDYKGLTDIKELMDWVLPAKVHLKPSPTLTSSPLNGSRAL